MDTEHKDVYAEGKETFIDEEDLKYLEELSEEDSDDLAAKVADAKKSSFVEAARMFKLRRDLDQLDCFHQQKEHDMLKTREKLKLCHENIDGLVQQRDHLEKEIEQHKARNNSAAVFRLRAQHKRLCQELQSEEELEAQISTKLKQQELELWKVEVDLGRVSSLRQEVQEEEHLFQVAKAEKAATRLQQEQKASQNLKLKMQQLRKKQADMLEKEEAKYQKKIEEVEVNRNKAAKYLKETLRRVNRQKAEEEQKKRELIQKKSQAVKALKSNIAATQESTRVQQSKAKTNAQKKEQQQRALRQSLQAQGINSIKHIYQQKQHEEFNRKKEEFKEQQKSKKVEIVAKILQEEQLLKRRNKHEALLPKRAFTDEVPSVGKTREKLLYYPEPSPPPATDTKVTLEMREYSGTSSASSVTSDLEDLDEAIHQEVEYQGIGDSLAEPEFSGLWDQNSKKFQIEKRKLLPTEEEKQEDAAMATGKLNTSARKVCGKELKGPPFISKPEVILFKDFELGKMYKKKIVLTNIGYITNSCKLLGLSAKLMDFISINFEPPGPLSAGMSCEMQAVFHPKTNKDLEGEVQFASAVGPFSVPIRCTTKKCDLEVDTQFIDFGSHVVGQTVSRTITLTNKGALSTLFSVDTSGCLSPEAGLVQMPSLISTNTCQDTSRQNLSSNIQKSSSSMAIGEFQPEQGGQQLSVALQQEQSDSVEPQTTCNADVSSFVDGQSTAVFSDLSFGSVREGEIRAFESIKLEIVFTPATPGETKLDFHIRFSDLTSKPIPIHVRGVAVSVPVWVVQSNIDLKICMFDRLYQDSILVQSRANMALKLAFEVCPEMRNHMEIVPKTGVIQAKSSFNAQLKFLPRSSLSEDAEMFFDSDTGVLEVPMTMQVAGQVQPVHFTVHAVVTSSDLQFDRTQVDFGFCSVSQSVKTSVALTNLSLLPQDFGFVGLPQFIDVQPNDGFGTLLPQETLKIDLIFSAHQAKRYCFQISCKSGVNREFHLSCRGVGVSPPLDMSHSLVQFGATALGDYSTALLYLINHHTDHKLSKQPAPPGKNEAKSKVTPRLFSFAVPKDSDFSISPSAGRLLPGQRCPVQVTFRPRLSELEIKEEALRLLHRAKLLRENMVERSRHTEQEEGPNKEKTTVNPKDFETTDGRLSPEDIQPGSEQYEDGKTSLLYSFTQRHRKYTVPCFVSEGEPSAEDQRAQPAWSAFNMLYLELHCPAVQPPLVVVSNNGQNVIDFHQVAVGEKMIQMFTVQNISKESLALRSSVLDIDGPFSLLNALRCVRPGEQHTLRLAFTPALGKKCEENLQLHSQKMSVEMTLRGEGVVPTVTSSHPGGVLDFSYVMVKETSFQVLKLQNSSAVPVGFRVLLASLSSSGPQRGADALLFIQGPYTDAHIQPTVGTQNYNGLSVFSVVPAEGSIAPGQSQDITVTFQPDHPSVNYSDRLTVELTNKSIVNVVDVKGAASSQNMYLCGGDQLMVPIESLLPPLIRDPQLTDTTEKSSTPVLLTLRARYSSGSVAPAVRELQVGCISSTQSDQKGGEFHWDDVVSLQQRGFRVEPTKGTVGVGHRCTITITWTPQAGHKPNEVVQMCVPLTVTGDKTSVYTVTLQALVSTD